MMGRLLDRFRMFMQGRYGNDKLNFVLLVVSLILTFTSSIFRFYPLYLIGLLLLVYVIFRQLSRNIYKRQAENEKFLRFWNKVTGWFRSQKVRFADRKTHCYYKCPTCHVTVRVPRGRGKLCITCPKCKNEFIRKT